MKKILSVFLTVILCIDVISIGIIILSKNNNKPADPDKTDENGLFERITVSAVGENIISQELLEQAYARTGSIKYDFDYPYENIASVISQADISILNQPSVISSEHNISGAPLFNSPAELGMQMARIGFDVVNLASPHSLDYGEKGLLNSIAYWKELGLSTVGAYASSQDAEAVTSIKAGGITVAFIGFTQESGGNSLPEGSSASLVLAQEESKLLDMVVSAKKEADIVVVCANWGEENQKEPNQAQIQLAEKLGQWGADVIIGTHTRTLMKTEYITNPDGSQTLVAYSLGSFISDDKKAENLLGGMLTFEIVKNTHTGSVSVENPTLDGVITHYGHKMTNLRVYPLKNYTTSLASKHGAGEKNSEFSLKYLKKMLEIYTIKK